MQTMTTRRRTCGISLTASAAAKSRAAHLNWDSTQPSPAKWRLLRCARGAPFNGIRTRWTSFKNRWHNPRVLMSKLNRVGEEGMPGTTNYSQTFTAALLTLSLLGGSYWATCQGTNHPAVECAAKHSVGTRTSVRNKSAAGFTPSSSQAHSRHKDRICHEETIHCEARPGSI